MEEPIRLYAGKARNDEPVVEEVAAKPLGNDQYELAVSPLLVLGVAAGDVVELTMESPGSFRVIRRSGNLAIQVFAPRMTDDFLIAHSHCISELGGRTDLRSPKGVASSVPLSTGFDVIEKKLNALVARFRDVEWYYGNVYDPTDGVTPLGWWLHRTSSPKRGGDSSDHERLVRGKGVKR
jgi:hypothetical protein